MEDTLFCSTSEHFGKPIDCRCLSLRVEFYFLPVDAAFEMAEEMLTWLSGMLSDSFIVRRYMQRKSISPDKTLLNLKNELQTKHHVFYTEEAMSISPVVYNVKTFRHYMQSTRFGEHGSPPLPSSVSIDYCDLWNSLFPNETVEPDTIKGKILQIFREEGRKLIAGYLMPDVHAAMNILPYKNHPNCYYGEFSVDFSAFCLGPHIDDMAEKFALFAEHVSRTYANLNIQVRLQPIGAHKSPYMALFGTGCNTDESHLEANCTEAEWYSTYYLPGIEWFNIVSPLARKHLQHTLPFTNSRSFDVKEIAGSLLVKSAKPISQFDIPDALEMKKWLYPALYPGRSYITFRTLFKDSIARKSMSVFPRSNWAVIPVFENEIEIVSNYLVFSCRSL